jgi:hypothetical protein
MASGALALVGIPLIVWLAIVLTTMPNRPAVSLTPTPLRAEASGDYALDLDGQSAFVEIPKIGLSGTAFTVEAWTWLRDAAPKTPEYLLYGQVPFFLQLKPMRYRARWLFQCGVKAKPVLASAEEVGGQWVHVAGVYDGRESRLYVNGVAQRTPSAEERTFNELSPLKIGCNPKGDDNFFDGLVDELHFSKAVRYTADFIPQRRFTPDENTLALYHCDDGQGDVLKDSSRNQNHAKITKPKWVSGVGTAVGSEMPSVDLDGK